MIEEYREINGFPNYKVSNLGNIKNIATNKILGKFKDTKGYQITFLYANKKRKTIKVHRLVATYFIQNNMGKPQVNHIDGDKFNNKLDNLEWSTNGENGKHAWSTGLRSSKSNIIKALILTTLKNKKLVLNTQSGIFYDSIGEAADSIGMGRSYLASILKGEYKNKTNLILA